MQIRCYIYWLILFSLPLLLACGGAASSSEETPTETDVIEDSSVSTDSPTPEDINQNEPKDTPAGLTTTTLAVFSTTPGKGLVQGGEGITIYGNGFTEGALVTLGGLQTSPPIFINSNLLTVITPPREPGYVDVEVLLPDGQESLLENGFLYYSAFAIEDVDPAFGPLTGGTAVTIRGFGFVPETSVLFDGRVGIDIHVIDDTEILALTPPGEEPGEVSVHVATNAGMFELEDGFTYEESLQLEKVAPPSGLIDGGEEVIFHGSGFSSEMTISFGGEPGELIEVSTDGRSATISTPAHSQGIVPVTVTTETETTILLNGFFFVDPLSINGSTEIFVVIPSTGPTAGNIPISIVASGLTSPFDTHVFIGETEANVADIDPIHGIVEVLLPTGDAGTVDVEIVSSNGSDIANDAFTYADLPEIETVSPPSGNIEGGEPIYIKGNNLGEITEIRVGALFATDLQIDNSKEIQAITPPGSPGWAHVHVYGPAGEGVLENAYLYKAGVMELLAISPDEGPMSGTAPVHLFGTDLPENGEVRFGSDLAYQYTFISPSEISVLPPPMAQPITVDVSIEDDEGNLSSLPASYTYFNPAAAWGGTWGGAIEGHMNATVLDIWTQEGVEDAFVMLWIDDETPYQGYTDWLGQISFTGPDLEGVQMVTAWKEGYSASSVVEFDAENVTLLLFPETPTSSGGGGGGGSSNPFSKLGTIEGTVIINEKYLIPPPGTCAGKPQDPEGVLCMPCEDEAACGDSANQCTPLVDGSTYCTTPCEIGADCPSGYACMAVALGEAKRCMPINGLVQVRCMTSRDDIFSTNPIAGPGEIADPLTGEFTLQSRPGELAVICQGELYSPQDNTTTPLALGAAFPVQVEEQTTTEGVIIYLDVPMDRDVDVSFDYPPSRLTYLPKHRLRTFLSFSDSGEYGVHEISRTIVDPDEAVVGLANMPSGLTGSLTGTNWYIIGGAYGETSTWVQWFPPYAAAIHRKLPTLAQNHLYGSSADGWIPIVGQVSAINDLWGADDDNVFAVGDNGGIYFYNGSDWSLQGSPFKSNWRTVWGTSADHVLAAGDTGAVIQYNGLVWVQIENIGVSARAITGVSAEDIVVVGDGGGAWQYNGNAWSPLDLNVESNLHGAWANPANEEMWVVGTEGTLLHRVGGLWTSISLPNAPNWYAVTGNSEHVYVAGAFGEIRRYDGEEWTALAIPTTETIFDLWVAADNTLFAVGTNGLVMKVLADESTLDESIPQSGAQLRSLWGSGASAQIIGGQDAMRFGPLLEVPQFEFPLSDGDLSNGDLFWTASGGATPDFNYVSMGSTWWKPLWQIILAGELFGTELPELASVLGADPLPNQTIPIEVTRVLMDDFDINNFDYFVLYFPFGFWDSWAVNNLEIWNN